MVRVCRAVRTSLAIGLALSGCASMQVRSDYDRNVDFTRYESFAWLERPVKPLAEAPEQQIPDAADPFAWNSLLDKRVRSAVDALLLSRGFRKTSGESPDFWLRYHTMLKDRVQITSFPAGVWPHGAGIGWTDIYVDSFQEGTLILDVIDPALNQLVWRGWAVRAVGDLTRQHDEVQLAVKRILERFPPPPRSD